MDACTNPDILRVIYFFLLIVDIVKIIIPIALIVLGTIDFSKSVITSDEKVQKKTVNLFLKRLLYAVLVFAVPWIVEVLIVTLGDLLGGEKINFTDCLDNANGECIEALDSKTVENINYYCDVSEDTSICYYCSSEDAYSWGTNPSLTCPGYYNSKRECTTNELGAECAKCESDGKWGVVKQCTGGWTKTNILKENCKSDTSMCYYCSSENVYSWGTNPSLTCPGYYNSKRECTTNEPGAECAKCESDGKWGVVTTCTSGWKPENKTKANCK